MHEIMSTMKIYIHMHIIPCSSQIFAHYNGYPVINEVMCIFISTWRQSDVQSKQ